MLTNRKVILHTAGEKPTDTKEQRCIRCHTLMSPRASCGWASGAIVAYSGHGNWSRLDDIILDRTQNRLCKGDRHAN